MFDIIPFILIISSLAIILFVVSRKFAVLANLDLDTIQAEREARFKEQILTNRFKRNFYSYHSKISNTIAPFWKGVKGMFHSVYSRLVEFRDDYRKEKTVRKEEGVTSMVGKLYVEIEDALKVGSLDAAEKKLIEIIGLDSKNTKAFKMLGDVYFEKKNYAEARETLGHVVRLVEKNIEEAISTGIEHDKEENSEILSSAYFSLALIEKEMANIEDSIKNIDNALRIKPNNPRFLDMKIGISIIKKDKILALDAFEKLAEANPENQKLEDLKRQINDL